MLIDLLTASANATYKDLFKTYFLLNIEKHYTISTFQNNYDTISRVIVPELSVYNRLVSEVDMATLAKS